MTKFHIFFMNKQEQLYYAYDKTWPAIVNAVVKDPPRSKMECPGLVLNRFNALNASDPMSIKNRYVLLKETTGWFSLDVDNAGEGLALYVRSALYKRCPQLRMVWVSSSGRGVKAIGYNQLLKNVTPELYKQQYEQICLQVRRQVGLQLNFDMACGRCHQPVFLNSDPQAKVRRS